MEPEGSSPHSQQPVTSPYPDSDPVYAPPPIQPLADPF
jgi:hypothetical protein